MNSNCLEPRNTVTVKGQVQLRYKKFKTDESEPYLTAGMSQPLIDPSRIGRGKNLKRADEPGVLRLAFKSAFNRREASGVAWRI